MNKKTELLFLLPVIALLLSCAPHWASFPESKVSLGKILDIDYKMSSDLLSTTIITIVKTEKRIVVFPMFKSFPLGVEAYYVHRGGYNQWFLIEGSYHKHPIGR